MRDKGFLICIEGLDKSGKTTQSHLLVNNLHQLGFRASYTTEPSRGAVGQFIRARILRRRRRVPAIVEALLFAADRYDHIETEIKPKLRERWIVVSDRYIYSSLAYQGAAGLDLEWIMEINKFSPNPDLAIYIDVPLDVLAERIRDDESVMEQMRTQRKVHDVYMRLVQEGRMVRIDGDRSIEEVSKSILDVVLSRLNRES